MCGSELSQAQDLHPRAYQYNCQDQHNPKAVKKAQDFEDEL
jgi:hypothetical protein